MSVEIDRLALRVPWDDADRGQELARRVADGLAPAGAGAEHIRVTLAGREREGVDELADRITAAVMRELGAVSR